MAPRGVVARGVVVQDAGVSREVWQVVVWRPCRAPRWSLCRGSAGVFAPQSRATQGAAQTASISAWPLFLDTQSEQLTQRVAVVLLAQAVGAVVRAAFDQHKTLG